MKRWILILMLVLPSLAQATDFYASPSGTGSACSAGAPCSLSTGWNQLGPGHTLLLYSGTYGFGGQEYSPPGVSGNSFNNPVRMKSVPGQTARFIGNFRFDNHGGNNAYWIIEDIVFDNEDSTSVAVGSGSFVRYINVEFKNARHSGVQGCDNGGCEFLNCRAYNNGQGPNGECHVSGSAGQCHGLYLSSGGGHLVDGGEYYLNQGSGLHIYPSVTSSTIRNTKLHSNVTMGIQIVRGGGTHDLYNIAAYNNGHFGIEVSSIGTARVSNNTAYNNAAVGLILRDSSNITAVNNIAMGNGDNIEATGNGTLTTNHNLCNTVEPDCQQTVNVAGFFVSPSMGDFHLSADDNGGVNLAGTTPQTDIEGFTRGDPPDRGAYEFGAVSEPPQPVGKNGEWLFNAGAGSSAVDTSGFGQTCVLNSPGWTVPGIIGAADLATNGSRWCQAAPAPEMHAITSQFGISGWWNGTGAGMGADGCDMFSDGDSKVARIAPNGNLVCFFYDGSTWNSITATTTNMLVGGAHHWSCSYQTGVAGADGLRARMDNASVAHAPFTTPVSYTLGGSVFIGHHGNGSANFTCGTGTIGNVRTFDQWITDLGNQQLYSERAPATGTSSTHWRFYQADVAENTPIAGSGVDAPTIVVARSSKMRQRWNVKQFGPTINEHFFTECNLNGGAFTTIDNSCAARPVCIAADSVKNMGDNTTNLLPTDGFTFVPGEFVVDTLNTGIQTTVADGQDTEWETGYAFNQGLADNDVVRCRLRTGAGDFGPSGYPAVLPAMTISVPAGGLAGGASMSGGQSRGGGRR